MLTLITNRHICGEENFIETVVEAIRADVDQVILREKDFDTMALIDFGKVFKSVMKPQQCLIIHSDIEAAKALTAEGVQLTYNVFMSMSLTEIHSLIEETGFKLGVSVHSFDEAIAAEAHGASYLLASHVFDTECKAGLPGRGVSFIKEICAGVDIPVIGLGGIDSGNAHEVISAGASGVAVMSGIMGGAKKTFIWQQID